MIASVFWGLYGMASAASFYSLDLPDSKPPGLSPSIIPEHTEPISPTIYYPSDDEGLVRQKRALKGKVCEIVLNEICETNYHGKMCERPRSDGEIRCHLIPEQDCRFEEEEVCE